MEASDRKGKNDRTTIEVLKAVLFGIVEGVTEWLPISSTGHLILLNEVVKLKVSVLNFTACSGS